MKNFVFYCLDKNFRFNYTKIKLFRLSKYEIRVAFVIGQLMVESVSKISEAEAAS